MESSTLWMGDIDKDMDKEFIIEAFKNVGYTAINVNEIFSRETGLRASYCFVDFGGIDVAREVLIKVNGEPIPGTKDKKFRLNRAAHGKSKAGNIEYSLFVADLTAEVTDAHLVDFFQAKYPSVRAAKVMKDTRGISKGFGFVRFYNEEEFKASITEMQGAKGLGQRPIKVDKALKRSEPTFNTPKQNDNTLGPLSEYPGWMQMQMNYMQQMHQYMQQCQQYAQQAASYAAWKGEQQFQQKQQRMAKDEPDENESEMLMDYVQKQHEEIMAKSAEMEESDLVDPNPPVDVDGMNRETIERDDKLFFELEASRWDFDNAVINALKQFPTRIS